LKSQGKSNNNSIFLHIHSSKIHKFSLKWNYTFGLGVMCIGLFLILSFSGSLLMIYYKPDTAKAYFSIKDLIYVIPSGRFVRNIHRWSAHLMIITCFLHMARVFYTSAYKRGREFNWNIGIGLFLLTLGLSFTGYLLPWDQLAYWACTIGVNIAASSTQLTDALGITGLVDPGTLLKHLLLGSDQIGNDALVRFYVLHCMLLPALLLVFIGIHLWHIRKNGGLSRPDRVTQKQQNGLSEKDLVLTYPHAFIREFTAFMFILALVVVLSYFFDAPLREPANPLVPENPAKAPWFFLGIQELVSYSGFTGGIAIPFFTVLTLSLFPYIDREKKDFGTWFNNKTGFRIALISLCFSMISCILLLVLATGFNWPEGMTDRHLIHFINPGTLLMLMSGAFSTLILFKHHSVRMGAIALFTCFLVTIIILTYFAWGHRGPNWDFYWWPLSWHH
jgi:quinol-cytochrome oxidoreductase complex cytochrome b subunit